MYLCCTPFSTLLGHIIYKDGLLVDPSKITVILGLEEPTNQRKVCVFLRHTGYYKNFITGYEIIFVPMEEFLKAKG